MRILLAVSGGVDSMYLANRAPELFPGAVPGKEVEQRARRGEEERLRLGGYYEDKGFLFTQGNGNPMHPDSVTTWLDRFSKQLDIISEGYRAQSLN